MMHPRPVSPPVLLTHPLMEATTIMSKTVFRHVVDIVEQAHCGACPEA